MEYRMLFFGNGSSQITLNDFGAAMSRCASNLEITPHPKETTLIIKQSVIPCGILRRITAGDDQCNKVIAEFVQRADQTANPQRAHVMQGLQNSTLIILCQLSGQASNLVEVKSAFHRTAGYLIKKGLGLMYDDDTGFHMQDGFVMGLQQDPSATPPHPEPILEASKSGAPIIRHNAAPKSFLEDYQQVPAQSNCEKISQHIRTWIGEVDTVYHEVVSSHVHIDVHIVKPTKNRPFYTLVTSGMSDRPMNTPRGKEHLRLAELMICLPPDWKLPDAHQPNQSPDEKDFWPIHGLKMLARMPHQLNTYLHWSHTVGGQKGLDIAPGLKFNTWLLEIPLLVPDEFRTLAIGEDEVIHFWAILPIYQEEADLKLAQGLEALEDRFGKYKISELLDPKRVNVCRKRFGIF